MSVKYEAYGKVNIGLDVLGRRANGYHDVRMIMQTVDLHDTLEFVRENDGKGRIILESESEEMPLNEENLIYRAVKLLQQDFGFQDSVRIRIEKRLPIAAGMAGGSSDCAAALKGINELFLLGLTQEQLQAYGVKLGADVPYCILGGTCLAEGIGEKLTRLKEIPDALLLIAKPPIAVSTKEVYERVDGRNIIKHPDIDGIIRAINEQNLIQMTKYMGNVLADVTEQMHPVIRNIRECMDENGAIVSLMSGSGPTVFGIFTEESTVLSAKKALEQCNLAKEIYVTRFQKQI